jgi:hypothetical protein
MSTEISELSCQDHKKVDASLVQSALVASIIGVTVPYPFNIIRTLQQTGVNKDARIGTIAREIIRTKGVRALYHGYSASVCLYCPGQAIYYSSYYYLNQEFEKSSFLGLGELSRDFTAGFLGMAAGTVLWCPMDNIVMR